jgi:tRNA threonylcarbamoyladenosine biosynthesis protein TsaB
MLLAIDTATRQLSLALHDGQRVVVEHSWRTANYHTVELAPQTALMLRRAGVEPGGLRGLAVALGPGSYTGLRIGLALAKGLAFAHSLPVIGVPTFEILMRGQAARTERVIALLHAGRGRWLVQDHFWDGRAWKADGAVRILDGAALANEVHLPAFICGDWDELAAEHQRALKGRATFDLPANSLRRAGHLAEIGWECLRAGQFGSALHLVPIYAGRPDGL